MRIQDMPEFQDKNQVLSFDANDDLCDAVDEMAKKNYGAVLVTRDGKLCGIFTERDLLRRVAGCRLELEGLKMKDVMTSELKTATTNDNVADCMRRMSQGRFRHMPIVDEEGNLMGMLSQGDFVAFTLSDLVSRLSSQAKAEVAAGRTTPLSILVAFIVYTLGLVLILAGMRF